MRVYYRDRAQLDIEKIYDWVARESLEAAQRVENAIRSAADLLAMRPEIGVATGYKSVRRWPMPDYHYTIFYRIASHGFVDVLRVVDGRQVRNLRRLPQ